MHDISKPEWDSWVGVGRDVLRYVQGLEWRIKELEARLSNAERLHAEQLAERNKVVTTQQRKIRHLTQQLKLAEEKLRASSHNTSKPPSTDPLSKRKPTLRLKTGKRRGGQWGHPFAKRKLTPIENVTLVRDHLPERCGKCNMRLNGNDQNPLRHQIVEIPMAQPQVYEYRLHSLRCECGHITRARLPEGVTANGYGPGVEGAVATLASCCRLSHRMIVEVMKDLFGVRMGLGSVTRILRRASAAVEKPVKEAKEYVRWYEGSKYVDETGWYQRGADGTNEDERQAWLWVTASEAATVFDVALSRSQKVAKQMLGEVAVGTVITDRYKGYSFIDVERRQLCWAHLYRDFVRMSERSGEAGRLGRQLKKLAEKLFRLRSQYQEGKLEENVWESESFGIRWRMQGLLERGAGVRVREQERSERTLTKNTCKEMLEVEAAMWLFLKKPEIGITNNEAERALRHAVLWRRVSFGSQSEAGAETVAKLLSVVMTLKRRGESVHKYLVEACRASHEGRAAPSLLPTSPSISNP